MLTPTAPPLDDRVDGGLDPAGLVRVAVLDVDGHGNGHGGDDAIGGVQRRTPVESAAIGHASAPGDSCARRGDRSGTRALHHPCAGRVPGVGQDEHVVVQTVELLCQSLLMAGAHVRFSWPVVTDGRSPLSRSGRPGHNGSGIPELIGGVCLALSASPPRTRPGSGSDCPACGRSSPASECCASRGTTACTFRGYAGSSRSSTRACRSTHRRTSRRPSTCSVISWDQGCRATTRRTCSPRHQRRSSRRSRRSCKPWSARRRRWSDSNWRISGAVGPRGCRPSSDDPSGGLEALADVVALYWESLPRAVLVADHRRGGS